jgi:signal transduction histidine kinase
MVVDDEDSLGHVPLIGKRLPADEGDVQKKNAKDTFETWLVGELLLVTLLGSATALFLTNPILRNTYELPEGRLVLDTAVVLAATIVAILAGVRFSVEGRVLDLLLAAGFCIAGVGTLAFSVAPVLGGSNQGAPEAWAAIGSRILAATLIALAPLVPAPRIIARKRALLTGIAMLLVALFAIWLPLRGFGARLSLLDSSDGRRAFELTVATSFLALLALVAVIGFAIRYRRRGEDLDSWLALGATLTLFAELHYVLTPRVSSDFISQGDFLRLLSYGVLLVGVWRAISFAEFGRAVAEERARVAREIHDGLAQYLFAISTHASMLESGTPLEQALPKLKEAAAAAQQEARFAVLALSSASGTAPFDAALRRYIEFLTADGSFDVDIEIDPAILLAPDEQIEVFRIVQEGLANVRKHAGAHHAEVWIGQRLGRRIVSVRDDGVGFDGEGAAAGQGLKNMRLRADTIEGGFALRSRPGRGTALEVVLRA